MPMTNVSSVKRSLTARAMGLMAGAVVLVAGLAVFLTWQAVHRATLHEMQRTFDRSAAIATLYLEQTVLAAERLSSEIITRHDLVQAVHAGDRPAARQQLLLQYDFDTSGLFDCLVISYEDDPRWVVGGFALHNREELADWLTTRATTHALQELSLGTMTSAEGEELDILHLTRRIMDPKTGRAVAALHSAMILSDRITLFNRIRNRAELSGIALLNNNRLVAGIGEIPTSALQAAASGPIFSNGPLRTVRRPITIAGLPAGMEIVMTLPAAIHGEYGDALAYHVVALGLAVVLIMAAVFWFLTRNITLPLRTLAGQARQSLSGPFKPLAVDHTHRDDELGRLVLAFNELTGFLRASEARNRAMIRVLPDLIFILDEEGRFLDCPSPGSDRVLQPEAFIGRTLEELFAPEQAQKAREHIKYALESGEVSSYDYDFGSGDTFEARVVRLSASKALLMGRNVTVQRRLEAELRRGNEEALRLNEVMAHHFQEPTRRMLIFSHLLLEKPALNHDHESRRHLLFINEQADRLRSLVQDILQYLALTQINFAQAPATASQEVLDAALKDVTPFMPEDFTLTITTPLPPVRFPKQTLVNLFAMLLKNGGQNRRADRSLRMEVSCRTDKGRAYFHFADNGCGILPQYRRQVFDLFARLLPASVPGTGVGLALLHKAVHSAGGHAEITEGLEGGACVVFDLPLA